MLSVAAAAGCAYVVLDPLQLVNCLLRSNQAESLKMVFQVSCHYSCRTLERVGADAYVHQAPAARKRPDQERAHRHLDLIYDFSGNSD